MSCSTDLLLLLCDIFFMIEDDVVVTTYISMYLLISISLSLYTIFFTNQYRARRETESDKDEKRIVDEKAVAESE